MSNVEFTSEYPTAIEPVLPEYFRRTTLEGLPPGQVSFPYSHVLGFDTLTQRLFIKSKVDIDKDAAEPDYVPGRAGVLRVYEAIGGTMVNGYIADLRYVEYGDLDSLSVTLPDDVRDDYKEDAKRWAAKDGVEYLLAAIFVDPDGKLHYMGDVSLMNHGRSLMAEVDKRAADADTPADDIEPTLND